MQRLVAIVGPTGIGKSQLAIRLAQEFRGEIVNADSRQVYRHMDIGTAKPGLSERTETAHHLIDIINPDEDFGLAQYQELASKAITTIHQRGKLPLLVGGSGQYIWACLEGWEIPRVTPDLQLRRQLEAKAAGGGILSLYQELMELDPEAAGKIDPRNVRRVIRALEVTHNAGIPFSRLQKKRGSPYDTMILGLTTNRAELYRLTDLRVDNMVQMGLIEEVKRLVSMGYGLHLPAMSSIGYRQIGQYLAGELTLEDAVRQVKHETHRFIRHQYNWFRLGDERIKWFDILDGEAEAKMQRHIREFIARQ